VNLFDLVPHNQVTSSSPHVILSILDRGGRPL
jgi:hypothetical protein